MSDQREATEALGRAVDRRATQVPDDLDGIGGLLTFPEAKQSYYAAGAYVFLDGEQQRAQEAAMSAIELFEQGLPGDRSFSDEAGARAELGLARVHSGDVEGARDALAPVLELAPERRIGGIVTSAARVHRALGQGRHAASPVARSLCADIGAF